MTSIAPKGESDDRKLDSIFDEATPEHTGIRKISEVRKDAASALDFKHEYDDITARKADFSRMPINHVPDAIREQVSSWERAFVMKATVVLDEDPDRNEAVLKTLNEIQAQHTSKIQGFEATPDGKKQAYTIYFKYVK